MVFSSIGIVGFVLWYSNSVMNLNKDQRSPILKNFFKYIDMFEFLKVLKDKTDKTRSNINDHLMNMVSRDTAPEDLELLFPILEDYNKTNETKK